jgi:GTPase SAR1 family protein
MDNYRKIVTVDGKNYLIEMLNTELDEEIYNYTESQFKAGHGFMLTCAINDRKSFEQLESTVPQIYHAKEIDDRLIPMILVVTKGDLVEQRQISNSEIREFTKRHALSGYIITSAKTAENCLEAIDMMIDVIKYRFMAKDVIEQVGKELSVTGYVPPAEVEKKKCIIS